MSVTADTLQKNRHSVEGRGVVNPCNPQCRNRAANFKQNFAKVDSRGKMEMAKMGRPKKPTTLKVLEGNPGKRPLPKNEPKPTPVVDVPNPPAWLNTYGKKAWKRLAPELERLGLLTVVDLEAFTAACQSYGIWVECEKFFKKKDPMTSKPYGRTYEYTNKAGETNEIARPEVKIGQKALEHFRSFMTEFGLSPSSRAGIDVKPTKQEKDPLENILSGVK